MFKNVALNSVVNCNCFSKINDDIQYIYIYIYIYSCVYIYMQSLVVDKLIER